MLGLRRQGAQVTAVPAEIDTLPADVQAAIEGAQIIVRPGNDADGAGAERIFVQWPGVKVHAWLYSIETAAESLAKVYPDLNEAQLKRACRAVAGVVKSQLRESSPYGQDRQPRKTNWVTNW